MARSHLRDADDRRPHRRRAGHHRLTALTFALRQRGALLCILFTHKFRQPLRCAKHVQDVLRPSPVTKNVARINPELQREWPYRNLHNKALEYGDTAEYKLLSLTFRAQGLISKPVLAQRRDISGNIVILKAFRIDVVCKSVANIPKNIYIPDLASQLASLNLGAYE